MDKDPLKLSDKVVDAAIEADYEYGRRKFPGFTNKFADCSDDDKRELRARYRSVLRAFLRAWL